MSDTITIAPIPGVTPSWMEAMESQLRAKKLIDWLLKVKPELARQWTVDEILLGKATPFAWNHESIQACLAASRTVPGDTVLSGWNIDTPAAWWRFDTALPFQTINLENEGLTAEDASRVGIKALGIGWVLVQQKSVKYPAGTLQSIVDNTLINGIPHVRCLGVSVWIDDVLRRAGPGFEMMPSQTWVWKEDETLDEMMVRVQREHQYIYGPGGEWERSPQVGEDVFMAATEGVSRFILAAMAWLNQKVLIETPGHIERHRRKDFNKITGQDIRAVKVISLRKAQRNPVSIDGTAESTKVEWTCQWEVDGHWRNQAHGPNRAERRLKWVGPYIKGPDDKPFRAPQRKVYVVNR